MIALAPVVRVDHSSGHIPHVEVATTDVVGGTVLGAVHQLLAWPEGRRLHTSHGVRAPRMVLGTLGEGHGAIKTARTEERRLVGARFVVYPVIAKVETNAGRIPRFLGQLGSQGHPRIRKDVEEQPTQFLPPEGGVRMWVILLVGTEVRRRASAYGVGREPDDAVLVPVAAPLPPT